MDGEKGKTDTVQMPMESEGISGKSITIQHYSKMSAMNHYVSSTHAAFAYLVLALMHRSALMSPGFQQ